MVFTLIYRSEASPDLGDNHISDILSESLSWNADHNLTGLLTYITGHHRYGSMGIFIQALEGEQLEVEAIFEKIKADNRHRNVTVVGKGEIAGRNFSAWKMGYEAVDLERNPELADFFQMDLKLPKGSQLDSANAFLKFLKSFYSER